MRSRWVLFAAAVAVALLSWATLSLAQTTGDAPGVRPEAVINLATPEGVRLVKGQWRYSEVKIVEVDHRSPGPDLRPSGPPNRTYDITPHAGAADFDDSKWESIDPSALETRRSTGRQSSGPPIWAKVGSVMYGVG